MILRFGAPATSGGARRRRWVEADPGRPSVSSVNGYRERLQRVGPSLTPAERRAADLLDDRPATVGFGTVAEVATEAGCGVATVARLAGKLGYSGFSDLQREVRRDLARRLRPAAERIRERTHDDDSRARLLQDHLDLEIDNLRDTLAPLDPERLGRVAGLLADPDHSVAMIGGAAATGAVRLAAGQLGLLRDDVVVVEGDPVTVQQRLALLPTASVVLACDVRRYDRWVVDAIRQAVAAGHRVIALTDSDLSPLAHGASEVVVVSAAGLGPFDSSTALVSVLHLLVAATAAGLAERAGARLERVERTWVEESALVDESTFPMR